MSATPKRKPKCSCGLVLLVDGRCRGGCHNHKSPAQAIRLSQKGSKEEGYNSGYLNYGEAYRGMLKAMSKT